MKQIDFRSRGSDEEERVRERQRPRRPLDSLVLVHPAAFAVRKIKGRHRSDAVACQSDMSGEGRCAGQKKTKKHRAPEPICTSERGFLLLRIKLISKLQ